jgi:hypothetical protein
MMTADEFSVARKRQPARMLSPASNIFPINLMGK